MIVDIILAGLLFYLVFPFLNGYCAAHYGRSFTLWFVIGLILPLISYFILFILISFDEGTSGKKLSKRDQMVADALVNKLIKEAEVKPASEKKSPMPKRS
jgi:hypothetical protein